MGRPYRFAHQDPLVPLYYVKVEYQIQISISPLQIGCLELILNEHPHHWDKLSLQVYQNQLQQVQCKHRWLQQRLLKLRCNQHKQRRPGSTCTGTKITNQLLRMIQNKWMLPKTGLHPNLKVTLPVFPHDVRKHLSKKTRERDPSITEKLEARLCW